jgi:hypothetical protein
MALTGTLGDFSVPDILQLIAIQKKTGYLTLKANETEVVTITFLNGCIVGADSLNKRLEERLGHVLTKSGKLTKEELTKALEIQKKTLQRLGYILITENFIEKETLKQALAVQMQQTIYRIFRWKTGDYNFQPQDVVDWDKDNVEPMNTESLMMEGVRIVDEWPLIEKKIANFEMVFEKIPLPSPPIVDERTHSSSLEDVWGGFGGEAVPKKPPKKADDGIVRLSQDEMSVYQRVNGILTVQEIIDQCGLSEFDTCKALFELLNRQLVKHTTVSDQALDAEEEGRFSLMQGLGSVAPYILTAWVALSVLLIPFHPLDRFPSPKSAYQKDHHVIATRILLHRAESAIWVYQLFNGELPPTLESVAQEGILPLSGLTDAQGTPLIYQVGEDSYTLAAKSREGKLMDDLTLYSVKSGQ